MAKLERRSSAWDINTLRSRIMDGILNGSASASLEEESFFSSGNAQCCTMVFERYSMMGSNRVSLTVTLFQVEGGPVYLSGITAGGSQAMFFKVNTFGEEAFLDKLRELLA